MLQGAKNKGEKIVHREFSSLPSGSCVCCGMLIQILFFFKNGHPETLKNNPALILERYRGELDRLDTFLGHETLGEGLELGPVPMDKDHLKAPVVGYVRMQ